MVGIRKTAKTYQPLKINMLHSFKTSGHVKLPSAQHNILKDQNCLHQRCENL